MFEFLRKLKFLSEKKMHLTRVRLEKSFVLSQYRDKINIDEADLRGELAKLHAIKNPTVKTKERIMEIERELNEAQGYKTMLAKAENTIEELEKIIEHVGDNLF